MVNHLFVQPFSYKFINIYGHKYDNLLAAMFAALLAPVRVLVLTAAPLFGAIFIFSPISVRKILVRIIAGADCPFSILCGQSCRNLLENACLLTEEISDLPIVSLELLRDYAQLAIIILAMSPW